MHSEVEKFRIQTLDFIQSINAKNDSNKHKVCPHCGYDDNIIKFGKFKGIQRYKCKVCKKTFSDVTNTPFYRSKKPLAYWLGYAKFMFGGMTIRQCSKMLKINIATAFFWRHKILDSIFFLENKEILSGEIQISDTYFVQSHKGEKGKKIARRPNPLCGKLGLDNYVSVLCLVYSNNKIVVDPICNNSFRLFGVRDWLEKRIELEPKATFISSVLKFNNKLAISIFKNKIRKGSHEETLIGRTLANQLKRWISQKFKGVATKYLNNYLVWFKYYMSHNFTTYKEFLSKKLNILMGLKNMSFSINRIKDYKEKTLILYGR